MKVLPIAAFLFSASATFGQSWQVTNCRIINHDANSDGIEVYQYVLNGEYWASAHPLNDFSCQIGLSSQVGGIGEDAWVPASIAADIEFTIELTYNGPGPGQQLMRTVEVTVTNGTNIDGGGTCDPVTGSIDFHSEIIGGVEGGIWTKDASIPNNSVYNFGFQEEPFEVQLADQDVVLAGTTFNKVPSGIQGVTKYRGTVRILTEPLCETAVDCVDGTYGVSQIQYDVNYAVTDVQF